VDAGFRGLVIERQRVDVAARSGNGGEDCTLKIRHAFDKDRIALLHN
jgi:hypothetical protein